MSILQAIAIQFGFWLLLIIVCSISVWFFRKARDRWFPDPNRNSEAAGAWRAALARMRRAVRPTLLLVPARDPGFSKIGGKPNLPSQTPWPTGDLGPRIFVAQIDLAAFQPHVQLDWLPSEGRLYAFFDDERNGCPDVVRILYALEPPGPPAEPPQPAPDKWRFEERRVGFMKFNSVPSLDWLEVDYATLGDHAEDEAGGTFEDCDLGEEIEHRIGGYPAEIQGGQMAIECEYMRRGLTRDYNDDVPDAIRRAAREWRLLLQIDSDPALNMNWWDGGRLYVFVRARDALRGDFSKTVTITQTH